MKIIVFLIIVSPTLSLSLYAEKFTVLDQLPALNAYDESVPQIKEKGAYLIFSRTRFDEDAIHFHKLYRIRTEAGRRDFHALLPFDNLMLLSGRVIDANGGIHKFHRESDVMDLLAYKSHDREQKFRVLIPPGLTGDCLVEIIWSVKAEGGLPGDEHSNMYPVNEDHFCLEKTFEFAKEMSKYVNPLWSHDTVELVSRFVWTRYPNQNDFDQKVRGNYTTLTYAKVPGLRRFPFDSLRDRGDMSWVMVFRTMPYQGYQAETFWHEYGKMYPPIFYQFHFTRSTSYKRWLESVRAQIPPGNTEKAVRRIHTLFREHFHLPEMTANNLLQNHQRGELEILPLDYDSLKKGFRRRMIYRKNFAIYLFQVYKDLGFKPRLLIAPYDPDQPFRIRDLNAFALDPLDPLFCFDLGKGKTAFLMAARPEFTSGYLLPRFRDRPLLQVDPFKGWKTEFRTLARDGTRHNTNRRQYQLKINAEGTLNFLAIDRPVGKREGELRRQIFANDAPAQRQLIQDFWHQQFPEGKIFRVEVKNPYDFDKSLVIQVKGGTRYPTDAGLIQLKPFPGDHFPLKLPATWPSPRKAKICLQENTGWHSKAKLELPPGWSIATLPSWKRENSLGTVSIEVVADSQKPGIYRAERQVLIRQGILPASEEPLLRDFLTWTQRAFDLTLEVRPGGKP